MTLILASAMGTNSPFRKAHALVGAAPLRRSEASDRKSTRLNSSHVAISYYPLPYTTLFRSLEMVVEVQHVKLFVLRIPVGADTFEDAGAVVEGMRHDADLGVGDGNEFAVQEGPRARGRGTLTEE